MAEDRIANEGRTTINGMMYDGSMGFFRSSDRVAPHNAYVTGQGLQDIAASLGLTRDYPAGYTPNLHFNKTDTELEGGETANSIILPYPVDSPWFEYNAEDKLYYRYEYGDAHTDMENGEQLKFKNVLVQYMEQEGYLDDPILLDLHVVGQGSGLYFTDGKVVPVTWEKKDYGEATQWFGPDGEPLMMNPGKTMIQVIQPELTITYSEEAAAPSGLEAVPVE